MRVRPGTFRYRALRLQTAMLPLLITMFPLCPCHSFHMARPKAWALPYYVCWIVLLGITRERVVPQFDFK